MNDDDKTSHAQHTERGDRLLQGYLDVRDQDAVNLIGNAIGETAYMRIARKAIHYTAHAIRQNRGVGAAVAASVAQLALPLPLDVDPPSTYDPRKNLGNPAAYTQWPPGMHMAGLSNTAPIPAAIREVFGHAAPTVLHVTPAQAQEGVSLPEALGPVTIGTPARKAPKPKLTQAERDRARALKTASKMAEARRKKAGAK